MRGKRRGDEEWRGERKGSQHGALTGMDRIGSKMNERQGVKVNKRDRVIDKEKQKREGECVSERKGKGER